MTPSKEMTDMRSPFDTPTGKIWYTIGALGMLTCCELADAQSARTHVPFRSSATIDAMVFPATFSRIRSVRELSDGRVLVVDAQERALLLTDSRSSVARQVGRKGDGPGEYRSPGAMLALGNDTTLVLDGTNRKWYLFDKEKSVPLTDAFRDVYLRVQEVHGVSRDGKALAVQPLGPIHQRGMVPGKPPELADSLAFSLVQPNGSIDTIARGRSGYLGMTAKRTIVNGSQENYLGILNPLQTNDQAILFVDGAIAVAYTDPYRVDWRNATGAWTRGSPVGDPSARVSELLKRRISDDYKRDDEGKPVFNQNDFPPWPRLVPPFGRRSILAGRDGNLYVLRVMLDSVQVVDIFDRSGWRVQSVALPPHTRFLDVGLRSVFVARTTDDGEEQLVRLRLTPAQR